MEVDSLAGQGFQGDFYRFNFQRLNFLLFPAPDFAPLAHFSRPQQQARGKLNVRFPLTPLLRYPHFFAPTHYVLLTDPAQALLLPFLLRLVPRCTVLVTSLAYHLARTALEAFFERISDLNTTHETPDFFAESERLELLEQVLGELQDWRELFSKAEMERTLERMVRVNYFQLWDSQQGVILRACPSGATNGSCVWELEAASSREKVLLLDDISLFGWRTCPPLALRRLHDSHRDQPFKAVVLTRRAAEGGVEGQEQKLAETLAKINARAGIGTSTTVVLGDSGLCVDLVPRLAVAPEGQVRAVLLGHRSLHALHSYVNSYADFLADHYREQLFSDSPDHPLVHYTRLREKGLLLAGTLEELALQRRLPPKEVVLQCHPFVRFVRDYEQVLELDDPGLLGSVRHQVEWLRVGHSIDGHKWQELLGGFGGARVLGFGRVPLGVGQLSTGQPFRVEYPPNASLLTCEHFREAPFQHFLLVGNTLRLNQGNCHIRTLPNNWSQKLQKALADKGVPATAEVGKVTAEGIEVELRNGEVRLRGSNGPAILLAGRWLEREARGMGKG